MGQREDYEFESFDSYQHTVVTLFQGESVWTQDVSWSDRWDLL